MPSKKPGKITFKGKIDPRLIPIDAGPGYEIVGAKVTDTPVEVWLSDVSGHLKPASDGRNAPATIICVSRHFSFNQAHCNLLLSGLFEREMPLCSKHLTQDRLAGSFRPFVAGLISTDDIQMAEL